MWLMVIDKKHRWWEEKNIKEYMEGMILEGEIRLKR